MERNREPDSYYEVDKNSKDYQIGYANGYYKGYDKGLKEGYKRGISVVRRKIILELKQSFPNLEVK